MDKNQNNYFTHEEMQMRIADYITGQLSTIETILFERGLKLNLDIELEVESMKERFTLADKDNYSNYLNMISSNVSANIIDKLHSDKEQNNHSFDFLPALVQVILIIIILPLLFKNVIFPPQKYKPVVSGAEISNLLENKLEINRPLLFAETPANSYNPLMQEIDLRESWTVPTELDSIISEGIIETIEIRDKDLNSLSENELLNIIEILKQEDFKNILKEINNVKINS